MPSTMTARRIAPRAGWSRRIRPRPGLLPFAFDLLAPTALLYILLWRGASLYLALLVSAALSAVSAMVAWRRNAGQGRFAPYMLGMALAAFGIALVTGSDRFLLAKESVLTAVMGVWFFASIWSDRPLTYRLTRPLLEGRIGRKDRSWEELWQREPRFRRTWRVSSVMWAVVLLVDAVARVIMAYTLPVTAVPALQTALMIATTLLMQPVTWIYYGRAGLWAMLHRPDPATG